MKRKNLMIKKGNHKNNHKINENILNTFKKYTINIPNNADNSSCSSFNIDINIRKLSYIDNTETFELSVRKDSGWTTPIEVTYNSLIADLRKINNMGVYLNELELFSISKFIKHNICDFNVKLAEVYPGFNVKNGKIQNFQAGYTVDHNGNFFKNDPRDGFPDAKGKFDISFINDFAIGDKHKLLLLHSLVAPFFALSAIEGQSINIPVIALNSKSSCEQIAAYRLAMSLAISPDFNGTNLDYRSEKKDICPCLSSNFGVPVSIYNVDEESLNSFIKFLSTLSTPVYSSGKKIIQLKNYIKRNHTNGTTILMTTIKPLLSLTFPDFPDIFSSVFPLDFEENELFKDASSLLRVKKYIEQNQGIVLPEIVHHIMKTNPRTLLQRLNKEKEDLQNGLIHTVLSEQNYLFSKDDEILLDEWGFYFATLKVVTEILLNVYSLNWDANAIIQYMLNTLIQILMEKRKLCRDSLIQDVLYPDLLKLKVDEIKKGDITIVYVRSEAFKGLIEKFINEYHLDCKVTTIKNILASKKLIIPFSGNTYYKNVHIHGKCYGVVKKEGTVA